MKVSPQNLIPPLLLLVAVLGMFAADNDVAAPEFNEGKSYTTRLRTEEQTIDGKKAHLQYVRIIPSQGAPIDRSGSLTTGGASQQLAAALEALLATQKTPNH